MIAEIATGTILAIAASFTVRQWVRLFAQSSSRQAAYETRFFDAVNQLAEDPDLDDHRLDLLLWLVAIIRSRQALAVVAAAVNDVEVQMRAGVVGRPAELSAVALTWHEMLFAWMMAVTYSRPIMGIWLRAKLARVLDPSVPVPVADSAIERRAPQAVRAFAH